MSTPKDRWHAVLVALLAIGSSAIGIVNQFTYDDRFVIQYNPAAHTLRRWWTVFSSSYWPASYGGDGYRPLTNLAFRIEYVVGGGHPMLFHAVNIALYAAAAVLVLVLARRILPAWAATLAAACFAVHPVHVEAVANVVGQSELIVAVALLAATILYCRDRSSGPLQSRTAAAIVGLYAVACFSKEHGIVLPAILLVAEFLLITEATPWRERLRRDRPFYLVLALVAVAMLAARSLAISDHSLGGFHPYTPFSSLRISPLDRVLTAVSVVPEWLRLFYWPVHLASEYGPADIRIAQGFGIEQVPGFAILAGTIALGWILRRREPVVSFGIAFACITLLPSSNFILPAGILLAERTLFLPSVGAMLVLGAVAVRVRDMLARRTASARPVRLAGAACAVLVLGAMGRSAMRTTVWHDNDRLFRRAVVDAPLGYRAHFMLGAWEFEQRHLREGEREYRRALALFPYDEFQAFALAEQYRAMGRCSAAIPLYRWSQALDARSPMGRAALAECLLVVGQYPEARTAALESMRRGGEVKAMRRVIFLADSAAAARDRKTDGGK